MRDHRPGKQNLRWYTVMLYFVKSWYGSREKKYEKASELIFNFYLFILFSSHFAFYLDLSGRCFWCSFFFCWAKLMGSRANGMRLKMPAPLFCFSQSHSPFISFLCWDFEYVFKSVPFFKKSLKIKGHHLLLSRRKKFPSALLGSSDWSKNYIGTRQINRRNSHKSLKTCIHGRDQRKLSSLLRIPDKAETLTLTTIFS